MQGNGRCIRHIEAGDWPITANATQLVARLPRQFPHTFALSAQGDNDRLAAVVGQSIFQQAMLSGSIQSNNRKRLPLQFGDGFRQILNEANRYEVKGA